jgi:hypothetical protein
MITVVACHRKDVTMLFCQEDSYFLKYETRKMSIS